MHAEIGLHPVVVQQGVVDVEQEDKVVQHGRSPLGQHDYRGAGIGGSVNGAGSAKRRTTFAVSRPSRLAPPSTIRLPA